MYILLLEREKPLFNSSYFVTDLQTRLQEFSQCCLETRLCSVVIQCFTELIYIPAEQPLINQTSLR